jgi:hypothetical protein
MFGRALAKGRPFSRAQRRIMPLVTTMDKHSHTYRQAKQLLTRANVNAAHRGQPTAVLPEDIEREALKKELASLTAVQQHAIDQDRERHASLRRKATGEDMFRENAHQGDGDDASNVADGPSSSHRCARYDTVNPLTGDSTVQEWFDDLVNRAIVKHCPLAKDAIRASELLQIIRKEMPTFSFRQNCDGVPFSLLIKNCCYLQTFGGKVCFLPVRREDYFSANDASFDISDAPQSFLHDETIVGLRKYKLRQMASQDDARQGPQPWLYSGKMLPHAARKDRRRR